MIRIVANSLGRCIDAQIAARTGAGTFDQLDKNTPGGNGHDSPASSPFMPSGTSWTPLRISEPSPWAP